MHREFPTGKGFADIVFIPRKNTQNPVIIVELKWDCTAKGAVNHPDYLTHPALNNKKKSSNTMVRIIKM